MSKRMEPAGSKAGHEKITARPGKPKASGYAEVRPWEATATNQPNPEVAGNLPAQAEAQLPGEEDEDAPDDTEETPPGEHKREPIKDPDPADTKLHVGA